MLPPSPLTDPDARDYRIRFFTGERHFVLEGWNAEGSVRLGYTLVATRVTRMGRAEPQTRRASRVRRNWSAGSAHGATGQRQDDSGDPIRWLLTGVSYVPRRLDDGRGHRPLGRRFPSPYRNLSAGPVARPPAPRTKCRD